MPAPTVWTPEELVNTTTALTQAHTTITALAGGGYVVAWDGQSAPGGVLYSYFQVYSPFGSLVGSETAIAHLSGSSAPTLAGLANGGFVVAYTGIDEFGSFGVMAQTFDAGGQSTGLGFTVNSEDDPFAPESQFAPVAAALDNGGFVVAYRTDHGDGTRSIRMQMFDADGGKQGSEILVLTDPEGTVDQIAIANTGNGLFAVTWQSGDPVDNDIVMQVFRQTGAAQTAIMPVTGSAHQSVPALAVDGTGNFLLVYRSSSNSEMFAQIRDADGDLIKTHFQVSDPAQNNASGFGPQVTGLHGGGWFVVWREFSMNSTPQLVGQMIDASGNKVGTELLLVDTGGAAATIGDYSLATLADGRIALSFDGVALTGSDTAGGSVRYLVLDPRNGTITGTDNSETLLGSMGNVADLIIAKEGDDQIYANTGKDTIYGNGGDDSIYGGAGDDSLIGGSGDDFYFIEDAGDIIVEAVGGGADTIVASGLDFTLAAGVEIEVLWLSNGGDFDLTGNELGQTLRGDFSNNKLMGMGGNDTLDGGTNVDYMEGGTGDDLYLVDHALEFIVEAANQGTDTVKTNGVSFSLESWDHVENLILTNGGDLDGTGNQLANMLTGNANDNELFGLGGNDTLIGLAANDTMYGGSGDDTYEVTEIGDLVVEHENEGTDTVNASINYTLTADVEKLNLTGSAGLTGTGNTLGNALKGNSGANALNGLDGNDTLDGQGGADTMTGGNHDDTYIVDAGDVVVEAADQGFDTVIAQTDYTLGANLEALSLLAGTTATGNELANTITGNAGENVIDGKAGTDTMTGGLGDDNYVGSEAGDLVVEALNAGFDSVTAFVDHTLAANVEKLTLAAGAKATGNGLANIIIGNAVANVLDGKGGSDAMTGLGGDDTYLVGEAGDLVAEAANGGTDTVIAQLDHTLGANVEKLVLAAGTNATGNGLANTIDGNAGANLLDGQGGNDTMAGGLGDDGYIVADLGDVIVEGAGAGTDTVHAAFDYTLGVNLEGLVLTGTAAKGIGNLGANTLVGNAGANTLAGGKGNDTLDGGGGKDALQGGKGSDTYVLGKSADKVSDSGGVDDTITSTSTRTLASFTGIENLTLVGTGSVNGTGNGVANDLIGNAGKNQLKGEGGNDLLRGGTGKDLLWGGAGDDTFDFNAIAEIGKSASKRDVIKDFDHLDDKIDLSTIDANLLVAGNGKFKFAAAEGSAFKGVAGQLIWDQKDGVTLVSGDINGDKVADFTLELTGLVSLTKVDFIL